MMHKPATTSWVRPPSNFIPAPEFGRPPGGSSPVIHFFREQETGARWIGKLGQVPLRDKNVLEAARRLPGFLGVYADEILEKLGLAVYQLLGTEVPESALSYQQVTMEAMHPDMLLAMQLNAEDEGGVFELPHSPRMHYLSRYVEEFQSLDTDFVEHYLAIAKRCGNEYVKIQTRDGEMLPLRGLGSMLAAADFVYDLDCLGDSCGNAGYVIKEDRATGERYAQLVKIDAGYAFSYSELRTDQTHNPRDRQIRVAPNQLRLQFADLAPADQREFAAAAKRILETPREEFAHLFSQTEHIEEGISKRHWHALLDGLIARKGMFLAAFAPEIDRTIVSEIAAAEANLALRLEKPETINAPSIEELFLQEKKEAKALEKLRVDLAVFDTTLGGSCEGKCRSFQLPPSNPNFIGRREILTQVAEQLSQTHRSVIGQNISGIGGIGKTQLALYYAHAVAKGEVLDEGKIAYPYDYIVWLNAETYLGGQFQALAEVWLKKHFKEQDAVQAIYRFLHHKRSLLIFDNAENARSIQQYFPPRQYKGSLHLLITSRSSDWGNISTIKLGGFTFDEAEEYINLHLGPQPKEHIATLVETLEGHPLALSQVVMYIKAGHCKIHDFAKHFYLNQANLLSHQLLLEGPYLKTVGTTFTLALAKIKLCSPLAEPLLGITAYLSPDGIQMQLLQQALNASSENAENTSNSDNILEKSHSGEDFYLISQTFSKKQILECIAVLQSYSLLSYDPATESVNIHRLLQETLRHLHKFQKDPHYYWKKTFNALNGLIVYDKRELEAMAKAGFAIPHVLYLSTASEHLQLGEKQELLLAGLLDKSGMHQLIIGNYEISLNCSKRALTIKRRRCRSSREKVETLINIADAYAALGQPRKQEKVLRKADRHYDADHNADPGWWRIALRLGNAFGAMGNTLYQYQSIINTEVLGYMLMVYGNDHPEVISAIESVANYFGLLERPWFQKLILEYTLNFNERYYGKMHPEVAKTLLHLANAYAAIGNHKQQKELLERALAILTNRYGAEHPDVAKALLELANAHGALGNSQQQTNLLHRALDINQRHYGRKHFEVIRALLHLANASGDTQLRKKLMIRILPLLQERYGDIHPDVAKISWDLASLYWVSNDYEKANDYAQQIITKFTKAYGNQHRLIIKANELLQMYEEQLSANCSSPQTKLPNETLLLQSEKESMGFVRAVFEWVENMQASNARELAIYGPHAAANCVGALVNILKEDAGWRQFLEEPEIYIPVELVDPVIEYVNSHPILLTASKRSSVAKHLAGQLQSGDALMADFRLEKLHTVQVSKLQIQQQALFELKFVKRYYGPRHVKVANVSLRLVQLYEKSGNTHKQKQLLERALPIIDEHYGSESEEAAKMLILLGKVYGTLGDAVKQKDTLERALFILERYHGPESQEWVLPLNDLSDAYGALGDLHKQKELLQRALFIIEKKEGHKYITGNKEIVTLLNLGTTEIALGNAKKGNKLLKQASRCHSEPEEKISLLPCMLAMRVNTKKDNKGMVRLEINNKDPRRKQRGILLSK